jgi:hypothetical protein
MIWKWTISRVNNGFFCIWFIKQYLNICMRIPNCWNFTVPRNETQRYSLFVSVKKKSLVVNMKHRPINKNQFWMPHPGPINIKPNPCKLFYKCYVRSIPVCPVCSSPSMQTRFRAGQGSDTCWKLQAWPCSTWSNYPEPTYELWGPGLFLGPPICLRARLPLFPPLLKPHIHWDVRQTRPAGTLQ